MSRLCSYFVNSLLPLVRHGEHVPAVACCLKAPRTCFLLLVVVHGGEARQGSRSCLVLSWEKRRGKKTECEDEAGEQREGDEQGGGESWNEVFLVVFLLIVCEAKACEAMYPTRSLQCSHVRRLRSSLHRPRPPRPCRTIYH